MKRRNRRFLDRLYDRVHHREVRGYDPMPSLGRGRFYLDIGTDRRLMQSISAQVTREELETLHASLGELLAETKPNGDGTYRWFIPEEAP